MYICRISWKWKPKRTQYHNDSLSLYPPLLYQWVYRKMLINVSVDFGGIIGDGDTPYCDPHPPTIGHVLLLVHEL